MKGSFIFRRLYFAHFVLVIICLHAFSEIIAQTTSTLSRHQQQVEKLLSQSRPFLHENIDSLHYYGNALLDYAARNNYKPAFSEGYNLLGIAYQVSGNTPEALDNFKKAISAVALPDQQKLLAAILLNKGNSEENIGNYVVALSDYLESMKLRKILNDSLGMAKCQNNVAQIYFRQGNTGESLKNFLASLEIKKQFGDSVSIVKSYNNIAVVYNEMKEYDKALQYFQYSKEYHERKNDVDEVAVALGNIAWTYDLMGKKDTALAKYLEVLNLPVAEIDPYTRVLTRINAGSLYIEEKDYKNAEKFLLRGLEEGKALHSKEDIREATKYLSRLYSQTGDYKKAFTYQQEYQAASDSILNEEKAAMLSEMQVKYETGKKEEQNKLLQKENELQGIMLERNRYVNAALAVFSVLILIIALLFISQTKLAAKQHAMELEQKILRSQMNPHFIFNSLQSIQGFIFESSPLEAGKYLSDFARLMRLILENSKSEYISIAREVETLNLYLVLQQLRFSNKMVYAIEIDPSIDQEAYQVPPMLLQPCIENAIEHGIRWKEELGKVKVSIQKEVNYFTFVVEDDGVGRNHKPLNGNTHKSMATSITSERLDLINKKATRKTTMVITDLVNPSGTRVEFKVPVREIV